MYTRNEQPNLPVRLSRYVDPVRNINLHLLWKGDECTEVDGDWGRYAALRDMGVNVVTYDSQQFALAVPSTIPLPRLIARGLTLCAGFLPQTVNSSEACRLSISNPRAISIYTEVPPTIGELAAAKLGQVLLD